jgi:glycosyltransferase involved in cell wall biosynthesis
LPADVKPIPKKAKTFGIVARFHPKKDFPTFFAAAAQVKATHPEARFIAAGQGVTLLNPEVTALLRRSGLAADAVDFRDEVSDMASFYRSIDALVLSSRTEGFPNVVAEAMSYGLPVATTDVGDAAIIVGDTGFVVRPRNPGALADAMCRILDLSPADYAARASKARDRVARNYTLDAVVEGYRSFMSGALQAKS